MKFAIFDMDGTLIDSSKAILVTINQARAKLGMSPLDVDFIVKTINDPSKNSTFEFFGTDKSDADSKKEFLLSFSANYIKFAKPYPGIIDMLKACKNQGFGVAVASNSPMYGLKDTLKATGIGEYLDEIIGVDENTRPKPDPQMLLRIKERENTQKCVFVGDSIKDKMAANNAKIPFIGVLWGYGNGFDDEICTQNPSDTFNKIKNILE